LTINTKASNSNTLSDHSSLFFYIVKTTTTTQSTLNGWKGKKMPNNSWFAPLCSR